MKTKTQCSTGLMGIILLLSVSSMSAATHYVSLGSSNAVPPFTTWATAATNIQDAVNVAATNDVVLVANGVYPGGITVTNPLALLSVNGPQFTLIDGGGTNTCVSMTNSASLTGFTLTNGMSSSSGGGVRCTYTASLTNCVLIGNSASYGGGASSCTLYNCTLSGNSATGGGGGAEFCILDNCALFGNSAPYRGGGAYHCTLNNCTLTGNSAPAIPGQPGSGYGGAAYKCRFFNCIAYFNTASGGGANYDTNSTLNYCCTTPLPTNGVGNIASDPQLASVSHLSAVSPCRGAGSAAYATGADIDGEAWNNPPSIGCDEYHLGALTGPLTVNLVANYTNVAVGYAVNLTAVIAGRITQSQWDFGDGTLATNEAYLTHRWAPAGDYQVTLWAFNESNPGGVSTTLTIHVVPPPVLYVAASSTHSQPPYTNWATAATNLQAAVGVPTLPGALVLVTNGVYPGSVTVTNPLAVLSVNGPQFTVINGYGTNLCVFLTSGVSLTGFTLTNGSSGVSCAEAFVTNCVITGNHGSGASGGTLYNCTLSSNPPASIYSSGGGANGCTLFNCTLSGNSGPGASSCTLYNCTLSGNSAHGRGGAYASTLYNCTLSGNSGGGANSCTLSNCTLSGNSAPEAFGGGASSSTLYNCTLSGNSAYWGGGAYASTLFNCTLSGNSAPAIPGRPGSGSGGGAYNSALQNCALFGNSAPGGYGGGAYSCTLSNCTLTGNSAPAIPGYLGDGYGGGAYNSTLYNCIAYFNTASGGDGNYDPYSMLSYCCTTPLPSAGVGNISLDPQLASASHLSADSPCRGAGSTAYATGTDIDGEPWNNPPSIGCDEYHAGFVTGPLTVSLVANYTNVSVGYVVNLTALIGGRVTDSVWEFGDGDVVLNEPYPTHSWTQAGDYVVALWAFNESNPGGVSATLTIHVVVAPPVVYVAASSTNSQPPYTNWATAATTLQAAVGAALPGALVLVTDGVYPGGVTVSRPVALLSVNGPQFTLVDGSGTNQCISLSSGVSLSGFTLTNGSGGASCAEAFVTNCVIIGNQGSGASGGTLYNCTLSSNSAASYTSSGGGAYAGTLYNCTLRGNSAYYGGGAYSCTLSNCILSGNSGYYYGGGAYAGTLYNCTLSGNSSTSGGGAYGGTLDDGGAYGYGGTLYNCVLSGNSGYDYGGGAAFCTLYNCTLFGNSATNGSGGTYDCTLNNCISFRNYPDADGGSPGRLNGNNWIGDPLFVDSTNGNLRLQSNAPCINAGNNAYVATITDLDGNPRIVRGSVDIGAYEYQGPGSVLSYAWLQQYDLPTDGSVDHADLDGTDLTVYQDWVAGLNPTNKQSTLALLPPSVTNNPAGLVIRWESVTNISYFLQRSTNLAAQPAFTTLQGNIIGQVGTTSYTDTNATGPGPFLYRVGVTALQPTYTVGGTLSGLTAGDSVVLTDNGGDGLAVTTNGSFTFATALPYGSTYNVFGGISRDGAFCTVTSGSGTIATSNISNVVVTCSAPHQCKTGFEVGSCPAMLNAGCTLVTNSYGEVGWDCNDSAYLWLLFGGPTGTGCTVSPTLGGNCNSYHALLH
jgi:hypothetical protein